MHEQCNIAIYADGATPELIIKHADNPLVAGFTTNPSLMKASGVKNYANFAQNIVKYTKGKPISFEVLGDDEDTMIRQGRIIAGWGDNVFVKVPIINSQNQTMGRVVQALQNDGVKLNITAIFEPAQIANLLPFCNNTTPMILSVFAGRLADVLIDPIPLVQQCHALMQNHPNMSLLWASTRQVFSAIEAERCGCKIITMPFDMIDKLAKRGTTPLDLSLYAVNDFLQSAKTAGLDL